MRLRSVWPRLARFGSSAVIGPPLDGPALADHGFAEMVRQSGGRSSLADRVNNAAPLFEGC